MKKYCLDLSISVLIFLFGIFALSNLGFIFNIPITNFYVIVSLIISLFYLYKCENFCKKTILFFTILFLSFVFSNFFIDTSFDGRCYHFTIENLLKLGYNPIYGNINEFASENNIYYNLLFASSYPNALELIRANFYLIFQNFEISKLVNFLFMFVGFLYSFYFFNNKLDKIKSILLSFCVILCSVSICQMPTKMADFAIYYVFCLQILSIFLIEKEIDKNKNTLILILSSVLAIGIKYIGLFNSLIVLGIYLIFKKKKALKPIVIIFFSSLVLCFQPYITNIIKFQNPLYPSLGHNKLDFMTKQNPKEFINKPYLYKFARSMFSSSSDARIGNSLTPKLYYKIPFTNHYDFPYGAEELRISGFGHLFSGIFIISVIVSIFLFRKYYLGYLFIYLTVFLNPLCWWARFVPQLYLISVLGGYCLLNEKKNRLGYILIILLITNGLWIFKENYSTNAYRTYVINKFYNELYSDNKKLDIYIKKENIDENDSTILARLEQYGISYNIVDKYDKSFEVPKIETTISDSYLIKKAP